MNHPGTPHSTDDSDDKQAFDVPLFGLSPNYYVHFNSSKSIASIQFKAKFCNEK